MENKAVIRLVCFLFIANVVSSCPTIPNFEGKNVTVLGVSPKGKLYIVDNNFVPWNVARLTCESTGLVLSVIKDKNENREVYRFLSTHGRADVWTAGNDLTKNGNYEWAKEGNPPITYFDWLTGSPPNDPNCGCISIVSAPPNSCGQDKCTGWEESVCSERRRTLCMLD